MLVNWLVNLGGAALFLFLFWRRLKEDYTSNIIFGVSFFVLAGFLSGFLVSKYFFPHWFFWLEAFGAFLGFSFGLVKYNTRFFETFEALFIAFLSWLTFYYWVEFTKKPSWGGGMVAFLNFGLILLFNFVDSRYKNFNWYKSGKIGLAGLLAAGVFFLVRAAIALEFPFVVSFPGRSEIVLSGVCAFSLFLLIYNLAKNK